MARKRPSMYLAEIVPPDEEPMKRIQHTLTAAELLNLHTTPITLLPSPGLGKRYVIFAGYCFYSFITTAYNLGANPLIYFGGATSIEWAVILTGLLDAVANAVSDAPVATGAAPAADFFNQPLTLKLGPGGQLTLGDGILLVVLYYATETDN